MLEPKLLDKVKITTARFPDLLNRAELFLKIGRNKKYLQELYDLRNQLVHHRHTVDMAKVNLLIINKIVPFLQQLTKDNPALQVKLKPNTWKQLRVVANKSTHAVYGELAKRITHSAENVRGMRQSRIQQLMAMTPELTESDELVAEGLMCPACKNLSVSAIRSWDADIDEFGQPFDVSVEAGVVCKVCGLRLDEEDVEIFIDDWDTFLGNTQSDEKKKWRSAFPDYFSSPPITSKDVDSLSEL